jgi:hypothetical protein
MSVKWGDRPSKSKPVTPNALTALDAFVSTPKGDVKRLNVDIPTALHRRVKARCAMAGQEMKEVIIELLEQRFPE